MTDENSTTRPDLESISTRASAATPGPWLIDPNEQGFMTEAGKMFITAPYHELEISEADAVFIAHAREDIPALLAAIDESLDVEHFREAVNKERASHADRGYDNAHDLAQGVSHLLRWAIDYASRGEVVKSGSLIMAALDVSNLEKRELHQALIERDKAQKALAGAPHDYRCALRIPMRFHNSWQCDCWKSAAPAAEQ